MLATAAQSTLKEKEMQLEVKMKMVRMGKCEKKTDGSSTDQVEPSFSDWFC